VKENTPIPFNLADKQAIACANSNLFTSSLNNLRQL